jgi:uncharacterized protein YjiS (DUF1127 family)
MSRNHHSLQPPATAAFGCAARGALRAWAQALRQRVRAWQRRREARASLAVLLDLCETHPHLMRDLGVDRGELLSIMKHPDDPTRARFNLTV